MTYLTSCSMLKNSLRADKVILHFVVEHDVFFGILDLNPQDFLYRSISIYADDWFFRMSPAFACCLELFFEPDILFMILLHFCEIFFLADTIFTVPATFRIMCDNNAYSAI